MTSVLATGQAVGAQTGSGTTVPPMTRPLVVRADAPPLSASVQDRVVADLDGFRQRTGSRLGVLVIGSTDGMGIDQFAASAAKAWNLHDGPDLVLVLATRDHTAAINFGTGLGARWDAAAGKRLLDQQVLPRLKADDPVEAVLAGESSIRTALGDSAASNDRPTSQGGAPSGSPTESTSDSSALFGRSQIVLGIVVAGGLVAVWLRRRNDRLRGDESRDDPPAS